MFSHYSWPEAILHIDGDAFFASVMESVNPALSGKPIVTGRERGIATAISYAAKKMGVRRGMTLSEIKKQCPNCMYIESDYELFSLVSKRMFDIMRSYCPYVEEYSIDEGFADIKGLRRMYRKSYNDIALMIKKDIETKLNITVSVGMSITKSLAKLSSSFRKPSGFTPVKGKHIEYLLKNRGVQDIWGLGPNTAAYLRQFNIKTALDFALLSEEFITSHLSKPYYEIWQELRGKKVYELQTNSKTTYQSISDTRTFTPPTNDKELLWAYLLTHVEHAFHKARTYHYCVGKISLFLKTQRFEYHQTEVTFTDKTGYPLLVRDELRQGFEKIYSPRFTYRTTGCTITDLEDTSLVQHSLFENKERQSKTQKLYAVLNKDHKIDFGTSLLIPRKKVEKEKRELAIPYLSLQK